MTEDIREMPELEPEIIEAAKNGSLVIFIGAGISRLAGHKSWNAFATSVLDQLVNNRVINHYDKQLINTLNDPRQRLSIAQILDNESKAKDCGIDYNEIFSVDPEKSKIYEYINLFECSFVTTNYDKMIKPKVSNREPQQDWRYYQRKDLLSAHLDKKGAVIHLHGCIDDPKSMIVTTHDYLNHYSSGEIPEFLRYLFSKKTVLFLGYGLQETEILEYLLKPSDQVGEDQIRLFILQGFFSSEQKLFNELCKYYKVSFNAKLIGFNRDYNDYEQQTIIIEKWSKSLTFNEPQLADAANAMIGELDD